MNLSARILSPVSDVNHYDYATEFQGTKGDAFDVHLQLIDKDQHKSSSGYNPEGNRHMPGAGATLQVTVLNVVATKSFTRFATQPFPLDASIWSVAFLTTDPIDGTVSLKLVFTESGVVRTFYMQAALRISGIQESC